MSQILIGVSEANQRLETLVTAAHITGFETGDVWTLKLNNSWRITFHSMSCTQEGPINQALRAVDAGMFDCSDPEDISRATLLAAVTRRTILEASVDRDANLTLCFEGDVTITLRSDTQVVDWQWCVTKHAADPYAAEAELACFVRSEVSARDHS